MPAIPGGIAIGTVYVAAPDGLMANWPFRVPLKGTGLTGGPAAAMGLAGGTESMFTFRPSGNVASCVPSPFGVTASCCEPGVAMALWLPTFQVSSDPDNVATNGACVAETNVVGGICGGEAMKPLEFERPFPVPYGMFTAVEEVVT